MNSTTNDNERNIRFDYRILDNKDAKIVNISQILLSEINEKKNIINNKYINNIIKYAEDKGIIDWKYYNNNMENIPADNEVNNSFIDDLENVNNMEAILYIKNLIIKNEELNEQNIKKIHTILLHDIKDDSGVYRTNNVKIVDGTIKPIIYEDIPNAMSELINRYNAYNEIHPIIKSALLHCEFVFIHPFNDGNGRTARLIMNYELMKNGFLPFIIKPNIRKKYYKALDKAMTYFDYTDFIKLIIEEENKVLDQCIENLNKY